MTQSLIPAVAVVGMGVALPGASNPAALWELLRRPHPFAEPPPDRLEQATLFSPDRNEPDRCYARVHGFLTDFRPHPRLRSEIGRGDVPDRDQPTIWLRHCVMQALDNVTLRGSDRGQVVTAINVLGSPGLEESLLVDGLATVSARDRHADQRAACAEELRAFFPASWRTPATLLPYRSARRAVDGLFPGDPGVLVVESACSSSLYTIGLGLRALQAGDCDIAVCGGVCALTRLWLVLTARLQALSAHGQTRSLDADQDGTVFSDGAAVIAMKRYDRALADKDPVLGIVHGFGSAADGRGKSLYAPNTAGQTLAFHRALADTEADPGDLDWIITHGTGTVVGDRAELTTLRTCATAATRWQLTSTKASVGHTGQAAGAVSAVHALLALNQGEIPAQPHFRAPSAPDLMDDHFAVPTSPLRWPAHHNRGRMVGVNAFGVGGTDAHLVLGDLPTRRARPTASAEPLTIVEWAAHLPDSPEPSEVTRWLAGGRRTWPDSFGSDYPLPNPVHVKTPPPVLARVDRTQLMALSCALRIWERIGERCEELRDNTGVIVGLTGPSRAQCACTTRIAAHYALGKLAGVDRPVSGGPPTNQLIERVIASAPPPNTDTIGGVLPNVAASRISARLDLHGPALAVDAGRDSGLAALDVAARYLAAGDIDLALVGAVNGHDADSLPFRPGTPVAEGGFMLAVTRADVARTRRLPVLARLRMTDSDATAQPEPGTSYLATDRLVAIIRAAVTGTKANVVAPVEDTATRSAWITPAVAQPRESVTDHDGRQRPLVMTTQDNAIIATHTVSGRPTVPAALMMEFAVDAATRLAPDLVPVAITDARFTRYLRHRATSGMPQIWISATQLPTDDEHRRRTTVLVRMGTTGPVAVPACAHMTVHLATSTTQGESCVAPTPRTDVSTVDPYQQAGSPVALTGVFSALDRPTLHSGGPTATFRISDPTWANQLTGYTLPVIAIDCLLRVAALAQSHNGLLPVAVPTAVPALTLHTSHNDVGLAQQFGTLDLLGSADGPHTHLVAADGRVLLRMREPTMRPLAWFNPDTSTFQEHQ